MKRARGEADGDSDAEDPGRPPEVEGPGQEEDDEAEYFRQAVGEEPDEDMFPNARWRRPIRPSSKKQRVKNQRPNGGTNRRPPKAKDRPCGLQTKLGPRGATWDNGQGRIRGRARPPKRVA